MASGITNEAKITFLGPAARAYYDELKQLAKEQLEEINRLKEQQWANVQKKSDFVDSYFNDELYNSLDRGKSKSKSNNDLDHRKRPESAPVQQHATVKNDSEQVKSLMYLEKEELDFAKQSEKKKSEPSSTTEPKRTRYLKLTSDDSHPNNAGGLNNKVDNELPLKENVKVVQVTKTSVKGITNELIDAAYIDQDHGTLASSHALPLKKIQGVEPKCTEKVNSGSCSSVSTLQKLKSDVEEKLKQLEMDSYGEKENNMNKNNARPPIKRPFLKKGAGLKRFMPKPISRTTIFNRKQKDQDKVDSQSGPVLQMTAKPDEMPYEPVIVKHVADDENEKNAKSVHPIIRSETASNSTSASDRRTVTFKKNEKLSQASTSDDNFASNLNIETTGMKHKHEKAIQASVPITNKDLTNVKVTAIMNKEKNQKSNVACLLSNNYDENGHPVAKPNFSLPSNDIYRRTIQALRETNQKEAKELIQYEILEEIAQTSVNSDSSLIMDILRAEDKDETHAKEYLQRHDMHSTRPVPPNSNDRDDLCFAAYKAELEERRKALIKEMGRCDEKMKLFQTSNFTQFLANVSSSEDEKSPPKQDSPTHVASNLKHNKDQSSSLKSDASGNKVPKNQGSSCSTGNVENEDILPVSSSVTLLREKLEELNKEIEIYKSQNAMMEKLRLLHENELKKLEKDKEDFKIFKANEIVKLENEVKEKKSQIMREKQTFEKYQKLKRELPGRKEKEEYESLKKKYESLQDEMKKKTVKTNAEIKRLRQQLDANNEKEVIALKAENKILLERLNSMAAAKVKESTSARLSKKPARRKEGMPKISQEDSESRVSSESYQSDDNDILKSEFFPLKENVFQSLTSSESVDSVSEVDDIHQVRFNLNPEIKTFSKDNPRVDYKEIKSSNHIERIFEDGHKEILYFNGSRKYISANGKYTKTKYFNGDIEEVFPDKHSAYTFASGYKQTFYPDGLKIYENPNTFVEKRYPDGVRQVTFNDNTVVIHRPDGSVERQNPNGGARVVFLDGTEVLRYPSGEVEVRTNDYIRHEFTDGTVKTVYKNGKCETNYSNGRLRIKDKGGNVIFDDIIVP